MKHELLKEVPLEELVTRAQSGDEDTQNYLLKKYQPFIAKCVSEVCKRYIDPERDDEFSIGLTAFNDAMRLFSPERGSSFLTFANLVIKRKVIDYIRSQNKYPQSISLDETYDEENMENPTEIEAVRDKYQQEQEGWYRREEILDFKKKLATYKLSIADLVEVAPKHRDARETAVSIARLIHDNHELSEYVEQKKKLPIKQLSSKVEVSKKTLERNRKFILAIFIILRGDYVFLKDYLKGVGQ
ncbi:RNA polymerase sigma factor SigI [Ornithinibacillus halotolerans]|uniref:RNA polymerase sigma factor SigI n=1 Tax=Ornithinibacillus halotolerans TaxID=1274357 RepID=A0A916RW72_9BACI|nr:RNA polymerase sigma factor SigI [Ornithinibacillus halotolerans]GGA73073.1 RNA polymerase sigma factor SigI [Ornithinibacillus halotolerans]